MKRRLAGPVPRLARTAVILQALAALAFVAALLNAEGVRLPFTGAGDWMLQAQFADAGGIHTGERTPVLVSGVPGGTVTSVRVDHGVALVTMRLDAASRGVLHSNATATIEPRSALEDLTIDISPGSRAYPVLQPGARLTAGQTTPTTTLDQVVSVLDVDTRTQLEILLDQLTHGIAGRGGELTAAVGQLHGLLNPATHLAGALARRRAYLSELVGSLSSLGATAQQHDGALASALSSGARTLSVTAAREGEIAASVRALPSTVATLDTALRQVHALAQPLAPALAGLGPTADALQGAVSAVRRVVPAVNGLLSAAAPFARDGGPPLTAAAATLGALPSAARALTPAIARMQPIVSAVNARRQGIAQLGERFSGVLSTNDAEGPILRGLGSFEAFSPADFGYPSATGAQRATLAAQAARALTLTCLHGQLVACLVRYLVPGLPGSVR